MDQTQDWDGHTRTGMQSYGNMVRIKHAPYKGSVLQTRYAHLSSYTFTSFTTTNIDYAGLCATWPGWLADIRANYDKVLPRYIHQYAKSAKGGVAGIATETDLNKIIKELPKMDKPTAPTKQTISLDPVTLPNAAAMEFYLLAKKYGLDNDKYYHAKYAD